MNQNVSSTQDPSQDKPLPGGKADAWAVLLDAVVVMAEHWKLLVVGPLIAGAVAYAGSFLLPKSYLSYAYLGPLDEATAKRSSTLILSPVVLDAALDKLPQQPFFSMMPEQRRLYLRQRIQFRPVQGADPKIASLYILEAVESEPSRARNMLTALIDSWLAAMKPPPEKLASLQRMQEAIEVQSADLSTAISELLNHPELLRPDIKTGYAPVNIVDMIKLRTEGVARTEELKSSIAGLSRDVIVLPPITPVDPVGVVKRTIVLITIGIAFVGLTAVLLFRGLLIPAIVRSAYAPRIHRLGDALRGRKVPPI